MAIGTATAIIGGSLLGAAGSAYAANQGSSAANRAANAQQAAADAATAEQRRQFDLVRSDTAGQRAIGNAALDRLSHLYGYGTLSDSGTLTGGTGTADMSGFFTSPDYQFNLNQGQQAIERSAAARGGLNSGNTLAAASQYAQGLASREYSGYMDRLMQQAGLGSTGIGASAAAGANAANNIGNAQINAGNARASGITGAANANAAGITGINSAIQGGISNQLLMQYLGNSGLQPYQITGLASQRM